MLFWMLFFSYLQKELILILPAGFMLSVVLSRGRVLKVIKNHVAILMTYFKNYKKNRISHLCMEPLIFALIPVIFLQFTVPIPIKWTAILLVIIGILNAFGPFAFIGEPLKFFYFAKFPLSIIIALELHSKYSFAAFSILVLEIMILIFSVYKGRNHSLTKNIKDAAGQIRKLHKKVIVFGKLYYPMFYYCGDRVMRKKHIPKDASPAEYFYLRSIGPNVNGDIIYKNSEMVIYSKLSSCENLGDKSNAT